MPFLSLYFYLFLSIYVPNVTFISHFLCPQCHISFYIPVVSSLNIYPQCHFYIPVLLYIYIYPSIYVLVTFLFLCIYPQCHISIPLCDIVTFLSLSFCLYYPPMSHFYPSLSIDISPVSHFYLSLSPYIHIYIYIYVTFHIPNLFLHVILNMMVVIDFINPSKPDIFYKFKV